MRLNINLPWKRKGDEPEAPKPIEPLSPLTVADVWDAPATFNRETRRRARLFGRIWRWETNVEGMRREFLPRYIRRHYRAETFLHPKTRRQRRHNARIIKMTKAMGGLPK